jgi:hypothetical protein
LLFTTSENLRCLCARMFGSARRHPSRPYSIAKYLQRRQIMKQLTRIHSRFYPVPSKQTVDQVTKRPIAVEPITTGFLTREELVTLYGQCGNYLHRGTIRQLVGNWEPTLDFDKIKIWVSKIVTLLNHHQIQTYQPDTQIWVLMQGEDGNVHWSIMKELPADDPRIPR